MKKGDSGFTLIELLVVIAIIGILAVVALPALFKNINKAKIAKVESNYNAIKTAELNYYAENNSFESNLKKLDIEHLDISKTPIGGDYKIRMKNNENKIVTEYGPIKAYNVQKDGKLGNYVDIDKYGDIYLSIQGFENNKLHINNEEFKSLVNKFGNENIFISSRPNSISYQTSEILIRIADNILPKPNDITK
ncbi:type IV pilin protein [Paraclostridium sordellii]|uniref:type IV pilin protein n=1 Tax=Paraclostridium sordellii TaxID=1505 RepID=UPI0005E1C061|nr:type II secretion system protein [Paeniclostridium sordellii]MDU4414887.1 type II secretion system protein [Paeniclostridium sordellii]MDU6482763.1 type II secretion system protein [Paeniclostridium sordellii]MRZ27465.1 prepilin-type N-terminal cleavage/methylation domain-containing protein [Paeniclostridium sordellii]MVO74039.1 prepilin-type N-terminal cleavage/methylation domain-containing protein [Paeniclostridium sordellii]CEN25813.1 pilin [[Clostridium] sordellii] [Paeniclostridium sor